MFEHGQKIFELADGLGIGQKFVKFFRCFFGKFKTPKSHSEIN